METAAQFDRVWIDSENATQLESGRVAERALPDSNLRIYYYPFMMQNFNETEKSKDQIESGNEITQEEKMVDQNVESKDKDVESKDKDVESKDKDVQALKSDQKSQKEVYDENLSKNESEIETQVTRPIKRRRLGGLVRRKPSTLMHVKKPASVTLDNHEKQLAKQERQVENRIRHLKRIQNHRETGEVDKLHVLTEKWRRACQLMIVDLMEKMEKHGGGDDGGFNRYGGSGGLVDNPFAYDPDGHDLSKQYENVCEDHDDIGCGTSVCEDGSLKQFMQRLNINLSLLRYNADTDTFAD